MQPPKAKLSSVQEVNFGGVEGRELHVNPNTFSEYSSSSTSSHSLENVPPLMRKASNKRIINQRPLNLPTKTLRMKSLLWSKPTVMLDQLSTGISSQLFPALIVNLAAISSGLSLAYSAIVLPQLKPYLDHQHSDHTGFYRPFTINEEEGSWIASVFGIGAIFGGFASGFLGSKVGRRKALFIMTIPDIFGWILIASSANLEMMLLGRFLCGFAASGYSPTIQVYIAEIAQPQHRGWISGITVPTLGLGSLLAYSLGAVISWHWLAMIGAIFPLLLIPGLLFLSDSPYWYMLNNQEKKALQVMERFRSSDANALAELLAISDSLRQPDDDQDMTLKESLLKIMHRQYRKPFLLLNFLFLLMSFSGKFAISFYAVEIFHDASGRLNEYYSAIIVGFIKLCGSLLYIPAIKHFSRRTLLCCSSFVMGISLSILGLAMYYNKKQSLLELSQLDWLPLACVIVYMIADPLGLGSIPFLYTAEFYPSFMRSLLSGITVGLSNIEMFLVVKTFPNMNHIVGHHGTFWFYASVCFIAVVFTYFFIPETKGKTLQEIEGFFAHKENIHVTPYVSPMGTPKNGKRSFTPYPHLSLQFTL